MFTRKFIAACLMLACAAVQANPVAPVHALDQSSEYGTNSVNTKADVFYRDRVAELSGGRLKIHLHPGAALGYRERDHFQVVGRGAAPIATTVSGTLAGFDPLFLLSSLPFLARDFDDAQLLLDIAMPHYKAFFEKHNQILLHAGWVDPSGIWASRPINSLPDLQQLKIRTYDATGTRLLQQVGAAPLVISWADLVPQLATGGVSAVLTGADGGASIRLWDYTKVFTQINYAMPLTFVHMNRDAYLALPEDLRAVLHQAAQDTQAWRKHQIAANLQAKYQQLADNGMQVIEVPAPELAAALGQANQPVVRAWEAQVGERASRILSEYESRRR
ncbi:TRAP transporter substrate-binding protein [Kerstersia gyiorum]|uniref:TRAP transporter substrate-binding protein n=1 Tax=Kerstersia gyiorum TaxID=206506 RepID=UPI0020A19D1F|nr:TRAP transporter substrate-binding protein [Kerstersia gyiorum]MCP1634051.1 TRAP-type C4-dicarboxylate transport system substrate-binding protein [Kerstersia gyiorum]MCP1683183.1 TRAP-type C4-dicarboxylate transport system substrate-binding protein [Kerstersia gyiorum]MCP1718853.1 TRAP-type C4-dicarboxylate transport system substrate-binding protein [Kerstersia gyiorum]MCW2187868.1 TRAP-type C4-dicarboxylate transport system substrate-binding protein [Kerstersia gyiorum]